MEINIYNKVYSPSGSEARGNIALTSFTFKMGFRKFIDYRIERCFAEYNFLRPLFIPVYLY